MMDECTKALVGSEHRDRWRWFHKQALGGEFYGGDGDFYFYEFISGEPRTVAFLCITSSLHGNVPNDAERAQARDMLGQGIPVYIAFAPKPDDYPQYFYEYRAFLSLEKRTTESLRGIQHKVTNAQEWRVFERRIRAEGLEARRRFPVMAY